MVKITNGVDVFEVSRGAFEGIYKNQGYVLAGEIPPAEHDEPLEDEQLTEDDAIFCDELLEKPIAQWKKNEIKKFCAIYEIDISKSKSSDEAKEIIKTYLDEREA